MSPTLLAKAVLAAGLAATTAFPGLLPQEPAHTPAEQAPAQEARPAQKASSTPKPQGAGEQELQVQGLSLSSDDTDRFMVAGVTWSVDGPEVTKVEVRVKEDSGWTGWESLELNGEATQAGGRVGTQPLVSNGAQGVRVRLSTADGSAPAQAKVSLVDPGTFEMDGQAPAVRAAYAAPSSSAVDRLKVPVVPRAGWGADESIRRDFGQQIQPKALVIHHTASTNSYTKEQASAQVRGIYAYHAKTLGWGDIGYNFLVDKFGTRYEGRYGSLDHVRTGAHTAGLNGQTMAISALGNYEQAQAPAAMVEAIESLAAWQSAKYGIDPRGTTTLTSWASTATTTVRHGYGEQFTAPTVFGHITSGYTACPGKYLIAQLPQIKDGIAARTQAATGAAGTPAPAPTTAAATGWVEVSGAAWVNVRSGPGTSYSALGTLAEGTRLETTGKASGSWEQVRTPWGAAWMHSGYLEPAAAPTSTATAGAVEVVKASYVNLRSGPGTSYPVVDGAVAGERLSLTGKTSGSWVQVSDGSSTMWIHGYYTQAVGSVSPVLDVWLRGTASWSGSKLVVVSAGERVFPTGRTYSGWTQVSTSSGSTGWILSSYLS